MSADPHDTQPAFQAIAIVGVGLLGGSIAAALKSRRAVAKVLGIGRNPTRLAAAQAAGLIDEFTQGCTDSLAEADLIVVCTPVDRIVDDVRKAARFCRPGTLITDVGSVKSSICSELSTGLPEGIAFVGSHPMAGSEQAGFEHADADLFLHRTCIVTPDDSTSADRLTQVELLWQTIGMRTIRMSPAAHDFAVAQTSHVPHLAASALSLTLEAGNRSLTATGFADTTRVAAGSPELWVPILMQNRSFVLDNLSRFTDSVEQFRRALEQSDAALLQKLLTEGKTNRDSLRG